MDEKASVSLTTEDQKLLERSLMASTEKLYEFGTAPAEMPAVYRIADEFERELFAWRNLPSRDGAALRACAYALAQKAETLFAPILAEKEREIEKLECDVAYYVDGNAVERIKHEGAVKRGLMVLEAKNDWRDRALAAEADRDAALLASRHEADMCQQALEDLKAAEAALAAEREVNAVLSKKLEIALAGLQRVSDMAPKAAAAIRAAEDDLGLGEVVGSSTS